MGRYYSSVVEVKSGSKHEIFLIVGSNPKIKCENQSYSVGYFYTSRATKKNTEFIKRP